MMRFFTRPEQSGRYCFWGLSVGFNMIVMKERSENCSHETNANNTSSVGPYTTDSGEIPFYRIAMQDVRK